MRFRFDKTVRLSSGVRVNLSADTAVVSAVASAPDGAAASQRGFITTLRLPGAGIFHSEQLIASRNPDDPVRRQEKLRVEELQQREEESRQALASGTTTQQRIEQTALVNAWRNEIIYIPPELYQQAAAPVPFVNHRTPPREPDLGFEKAQLAVETINRHLARQPVPWLFRLCTIAGSLFAGFLAFLCMGGILGFLLGVLVTAVVCPVVWAGVTAWWAQEFKTSVSRETEAAWPQLLQELVANFDREQERYNLEVDEERQIWEQRERDRSGFCNLLLEGDIEALNQALLDSIGDLNFPVETKCETSAVNPALAIINLELPEINAVIAEHEQHTGAGGNISNVKRPQYARYAAYSQFVAGLTLSQSATACSAAPTLQRVSLAAYTQRRARGESCDEYVLHTTITRAAMVHIDAIRTSDPQVSLANMETTMQVLQNGKLKTIEPPEWQSMQ